MALLAEQKRKTKFGLDPRNTNWSNDDSKFGQRLMEKMGWEKGKGLGAKENGMTEHIKASYKSDTRGLGCTPKDADAWIAHQDDFNELLKTLNSQSGSGEVKEEKQKTQAEKVKDGHKRYYGRFSRGRVQTLRSTEDLDCIFGRRKQSEPSTPEVNSAANSDSDGDPAEENRHGLTTVTSSSSVQEYFAKKMAEMKARKQAAGAEKIVNGEMECDDEKKSKPKKDQDKTSERVPAVYGAVGFSYASAPDSSKNGDQDGTEGSKEEADQLTSRGWYQELGKDDEKEVKDKSRKKKKKRKNGKEDEMNNVEVNKQEADMSQDLSEEAAEEGKKEEKQRKKKKKKSKEVEEQDIVDVKPQVNEAPTESTEDGKTKKKSKKRKRDVVDLPERDSAVMNEGSETNKKEASGVEECSKKKKRKLKNYKNEEDSAETEVAIVPENVTHNKDRDTNDTEKTEESIKEKMPCDRGDSEKGGKKRKKKRSSNNTCTTETVDEEECAMNHSNNLPEDCQDKRKKKKRKDKDTKDKNEVKESNDKGKEEKVKAAEEESGQTVTDKNQKMIMKLEKKMMKKKVKAKDKKKRKAQMNQSFPGSNVSQISGYEGMDQSLPHSSNSRAESFNKFS